MSWLFSRRWWRATRRASRRLEYADDPRELLRTFDAEVAGVQSFCPRLWEADPRNSRVDDGMAYRMDRIAATGNGQVPAVAIGALLALCKS